MTHYHYIEDQNGDLIDNVPFCSDSCHREWHTLQTDSSLIEYEGWNGRHEQIDYNEYCANCGVICACGPDACECQRGNIIVNRFTVTETEFCEHGNIIQVGKDKE